MGLTQIRGEQIQNGIITDAHVDVNNPITYSKLDLAASLIGTDLAADTSIERRVLESHLIAMWDLVLAFNAVGSSDVVTTELLASSAIDVVTNTGNEKGILTTGSGVTGVGFTNYMVQVRDSATGDPVNDGLVAGNGGNVYGELTEVGGVYTLSYKKSDDTAYTFGIATDIDFMFVEVTTYLDLPLMGIVNGMGFADVVGVAGTHQHDDRYYTETELDAGQLDNRYYTETELDAGQLDNRYYTETELSPIAAADANVLDARYYTESEIGSTATSKGASLVGVETITNLAATDAQAAFAELQGDIDNITSGALDITHSLDDAYDDGSVIVADTTDVDFQLTDDVSFRVADVLGAVDILKVTAAAAGDSVTIIGGVAVTGDSTLTGAFEVVGASTMDAVTMAGNLAQSGGTVALIASGAATIQGSSGAASLQTVTGGDVILSSAANVTFNDSIQTSAINFSQTNADGFVTEFVYTTPADFDWSARDIGITAVSSIMAAINSNREDINEYVSLLRTQGSTTVGANLIGTDGITGITPTGGTLGGDADLQAMLEGIALTGGGSDLHFDDLLAFTTAKAAGAYFNVDTQIWVEDIERQIRVYTQDTAVVEGVDWDYIWGEARPMGGTSGTSTPKFHSIIDATGTEAIKLQTTNAGGGIEITAGAILRSNGAVITMNSSGEMYLKDGFLSSYISLSQTGVAALVGFDTATSVVGALNENAADLAALITELATVDDGAAGADGVGVTGITGIIPTGGTVGADGTVQSMLEGLALAAGGITTYADTAAFTTDKAADSYLPVDTMVYFKDSDRLGIVILDNTQVVEGTDWDYLWGANQPMAGDAFNITSDAVTVDTTGAMNINVDTGFRVDDDTGAFIDMTNAGGLDLVSTVGNVTLATMGVGPVILAAQGTGQVRVQAYNSTATNSVEITSLKGGIDINAATDKHITVDTAGLGQIQLASATEIDLNAPEIDIHGDVTIAADKQLNVDLINITSVDPTDNATISGQRSGTLALTNILTNSGFEAGLAGDADDWIEGASATRSEVERFYNANSMHIVATDLVATEHALTQAIIGTTASTAHNVSFYARGAVGGAVTVQLNGGAAVAIDMSLLDGTWRRFDVDLGLDNTADGNFYLDIAGSGTEDYDFYVDAMMVSEGVLVDYFSTSMSELVFTIGSDDNDRIVMRSAGTTTTDLMVVNQNTVEILGDLLVSGTTTTVNSANLLVADNTILLNSGQTSGLLDAFVEVDRGTDPNVALKWNESTNVWELTNDGTTYAAIVTSGATGALSMDEAYDGGSAVSVDDTNVAFTIAATKSFAVIDSTDASKFVITNGSGVDSIKIDTTGGVDIDVDAGFRIDENSGSYLDIEAGGGIEIVSINDTARLLATGTGAAVIQSASAHTSVLANGNSDVNSVTIGTALGGIDIDAALGVTIDATGISLDSDAASNFTVAGANLTLATTTSGNVVLNAATTVDIDAGTAVNVDATNISTTGILTQTGATQIVGALNMDGAVDMDGATATFNLTDTGASSFVINTLGGVDIDVENGFVVTDTGTAGVVELTAAGAWHVGTSTANIQTVSNVSVQSNSGIVTLNALASTAANSVTINSTAGGIDIDAALGFTVDATGISLDSDAAANFTVAGANLTLATTTSGNVVIDSVASATIDAVGVSIDGTAASNVSVTEANLTISTITSGNVIVSAAGEIQFTDSRFTAIEFSDAANATFTGGGTSIVGAINAAYDAAMGANTLDEVYDGQTGTRTITMDNGSIEFAMTDNYEFNIADSLGADILSVKALLAGNTVSVAGAFDVTGASTMDAVTMVGNLAQSGGTVVLNSNGTIDLDATGAMTVDSDSFVVNTSGGAGVGIVATSAGLALHTVTSGAMTINSAGIIDMNAAAYIDIDAVGAYNLDAAGIALASSAAGSFAVTGADLTLSTVTTGAIVLAAAGALDIDAAASSSIMVTGADLTIGTITSGELNFDDARTAAIPFSDASNTTLPGAATSILGAIQVAYDHGTATAFGYEETTATSTDVTNDYIVLTDADSLYPTTGTFPMVPSALRALASKTYTAVYLNGLRLADTEWKYTYASLEARITFDGTDNIVLVAGDKIMIETRKVVTV